MSFCPGIKNWTKGKWVKKLLKQIQVQFGISIPPTTVLLFSSWHSLNCVTNTVKLRTLQSPVSQMQMMRENCYVVLDGLSLNCRVLLNKAIRLLFGI